MNTGMKRYIEQLIEDLATAKANAGVKLSLLHKNSYSNEYTPVCEEKDAGICVSDLIGMEKFFFPRTNYLNNIEVSELTNELIEVYKAHGLNPIFAPCTTDLIKYGHLRAYITHQVFPLEGQMVDIEMCDYLPTDCPFAFLCPSAKNGSKCCEEHKKRA